MLVEIGAATLCCQLNITSEPRPDHAQYVDHWLKILRGDTKAIFSASAVASRAIDAVKLLNVTTPGWLRSSWRSPVNIRPNRNLDLPGYSVNIALSPQAQTAAKKAYGVLRNGCHHTTGWQPMAH